MCENGDLILGSFLLGFDFYGVGGGGGTTSPVAWRRCSSASAGTDFGFATGLFGGLGGPQIPTIDLLVASARSQLVLDLPDVATSPPRGGTQLVGVPVWFWVENSAPVTTTASVPGLAATLVATPEVTHVALTGGPSQASADRITIDCPGPGTPWEPGRYSDRASSDCSHPFDWNGTFTVDATVDWTLHWTASNGQAGDLPAIARTTTFTMTILEAEAVTD